MICVLDALDHFNVACFIIIIFFFRINWIWLKFDRRELWFDACKVQNRYATWKINLVSVGSRFRNRNSHEFQVRCVCVSESRVRIYFHIYIFMANGIAVIQMLPANHLSHVTQITIFMCISFSSSSSFPSQLIEPLTRIAACARLTFNVFCFFFLSFPINIIFFFLFFAYLSYRNINDFFRTSISIRSVSNLTCLHAQLLSR